MNRTLPSLLRRLRSEDGVAMTVAVGALAALALFGASSIAFSTTNYGAASRSKADLSAFALAEAGVNNAVAVLANPSNDPTNGALLPGTSETHEGGTATWSGVYDAGTQTWTITAVGELRNPTGPGAAPVKRKIVAKVPVTPGQSGPTQPLANNSWNYVVATRTGNACDETLSSSVVVGAPLYTFGNLCLGAASQVTGGPVAVQGSVTLGTGSSIGTVSSPVSEVHVAKGCSGQQCSSSVGVHASLFTQSPPVMTAPVVDWDFWYQNAAPGTTASRERGTGTVPSFDINSGRDKSLTAITSLTPPASFSCQVGPPGNPTGELSWDATTRVLTVKGSIFIVGQVRIDNGRINTYQGQGVIYTSGAFSVQNGSKMCAVVAGLDCDFTPNAWDPNTKFLAVVSNGNGGLSVLAGNSIQLGCTDRLQGGLFGTNAIYFAGGASPAKHQGPIIASTVTLSTTAQLMPFGTLRTVPQGLPGQPPSARGGVGKPLYVT